MQPEVTLRTFSLLAILASTAPAQTPVRYVCPGGRTFDVEYLPAPNGQPGRAVLRLPGQPPLTLPQVRSASGIRYSEGQTTLHSKGDSAWIESPSLRVQACKASPSAAPTAALSGMFQDAAGAPVFTDCATHRLLTVTLGQDYPTLQRAYTQQRAAPGAPLYVTLQARIENRGTMPTVVVERFISAHAGQQCAGAAATLEAKWRLTELGGQPVQAARPPDMEFRPANRQVDGFGGCNRFSGPYQESGTTLRIGPLISTKMACAGPAMRMENQLLRSMEQVTAFELADGGLTLLGSGGERLSRWQRE